MPTVLQASSYCVFLLLVQIDGHGTPFLVELSSPAAFPAPPLAAASPAYVRSRMRLPDPHLSTAPRCESKETRGSVSKWIFCNQAAQPT